MLVAGLPRHSNYVRALLGEHADWTVDTYMAANIADALRVLIWQNTDDAAKKTPKHFPKPMWRPGADEDDEPTPSTSTDEKHYGGNVSLTLAELEARFGRGGAPSKRRASSKAAKKPPTRRATATPTTPD